MFFSFANIIAWLSAYKYLVLFPVAVLEGPIVTVLAGFLASLGHLNLYLAYLIVICGDITGDVLYYWVGRAGRKNILPKYGRYLGLNQERLAFVEKHFDNHTKKTLVLGKFTHSFGLAILVASGIARVDFWEFLWVNALGTVVKSALLILIGFYFGQYYVQINNYINATVYWMLAGAAVLMLGYWLMVKITQKYFSK